MIGLRASCRHYTRTCNGFARASACVDEMPLLYLLQMPLLYLLEMQPLMLAGCCLTRRGMDSAMEHHRRLDVPSGNEALSFSWAQSVPSARSPHAMADAPGPVLTPDILEAYLRDDYPPNQIRLSPEEASTQGCRRVSGMQGFRSSAACKAISILSIAIFAVLSAFPAKSVSALPPFRCRLAY